MSTPNTNPVVAVVGQRTPLRFLATERPSSPIVATFFARETDDTESLDDAMRRPPSTSWTEELAVKPLHRSKDGKAVLWEAQWVASVQEDKKAVAASTHIVAVSVRAANSGSVPTVNLVRIPGFSVTDNRRLHELMIHEFAAKGSQNDWTFDPTPLESFIQRLSATQRLLLASYSRERLVVFITIRGKDMSRPMFVDNCEKGSGRKGAYANASLSVFHCKGVGSKVDLVCHTDHFCVNTGNSFPNRSTPDTVKLLSKIRGWMSPNNRNPKRFELTPESHKETVYIRLINTGQSLTLDGPEKTIRGLRGSVWEGLAKADLVA